MHEMSNGQETSTVDTKIYTINKQSTKKIENAQIKDEEQLMKTNSMDTIDIVFENITYTVSLGCRKGQESSYKFKRFLYFFPSVCFF